MYFNNPVCSDVSFLLFDTILVGFLYTYRQRHRFCDFL